MKKTEQKCEINNYYIQAYLLELRKSQFCVNNNNNNSIQLFVGVKEKHNKINKGFILQS